MPRCASRNDLVGPIRTCTGAAVDRRAYVYKGLAFSFGAMGYGQAGVDAYFGYTITVDMLAGPAVFGGVSLNTQPLDWYQTPTEAVSVTGYRHGIAVGSARFALPPDRTFRFYASPFSVAVDSLEFVGGDHFGTRYSYWAMNALDISPVPEPPAYALALAGLLTLAATRRARRSHMHRQLRAPAWG